MMTTLADHNPAELKTAARKIVADIGNLDQVKPTFWVEVARGLIGAGALTATQITLTAPSMLQQAELRMKFNRTHLEWDAYSGDAKYKDGAVTWWILMARYSLAVT
jgi:hypothetical protein